MSYLESPPTWSITLQSYQTLNENLDSVQGIEQQHPYWSKVKYIAKNVELEPKQLWSAIKAFRALTAIKLPFPDGFFYNATNWLDAQLFQLDRKSQGLILDTIGSTAVLQRKKYIASGLLNEAFSSSTLEGAVATRYRAKELIDKKSRPATKGEQMILNNFHAMEYIRNTYSSPLTLQALFELHEILGRNAMDQGIPGAFRGVEETVTVHDELTGEDIHIPPPASELYARMENLIAFFNADIHDASQTFIHPILRACIVHFMIGYIHPFSDGNGRIARALFYWHLLRNGYWIAEYLSISQVILESKSSYYKAYAHTELDGNDLTYFLNYKVGVIAKSFDKLKEYLENSLTEIESENPELASQLGISIRQADLLQKIKAKPRVWKVQDAERVLSVSHATARADLNALADKGVLERFNLDKKTQAWRLV